MTGQPGDRSGAVDGGRGDPGGVAAGRSPRILVTGGSGFVGGAVGRVLAGIPDADVRWLVHERPVLEASTVAGDLARPASLAGCCDGIDVVLHLAGAVGADEATARAVTVEGTRALLAEAGRAGVRDVVLSGTAAVHGLGPHRGLPESAPPAPVSATSRARLAAEEMALAHGGVVLRPFLTYGPGDRWFVPTLLRRLLRRRWAWPVAGWAAQSVVAVDDLAAVLVAAALRPAGFGGSPLHVCEPTPVPAGAVMSWLAERYGLPRPGPGLPAAPLLAGLRLAGRHRAYRRLELLAVEHTYASERAWVAAGVCPGPPMLERLGDYTDWYARFAGHPPVGRLR